MENSEIRQGARQLLQKRRIFLPNGADHLCIVGTLPQVDYLKLSLWGGRYELRSHMSGQVVCDRPDCLLAARLALRRGALTPPHYDPHTLWSQVLDFLKLVLSKACFERNFAASSVLGVSLDHTLLTIMTDDRRAPERITQMDSVLRYAVLNTLDYPIRLKFQTS